MKNSIGSSIIQKQIIMDMELNLSNPKRRLFVLWY